MGKGKKIVSFLPYRRRGDEWEFYLQMRDSNAPTHANIFSLFGGHVEEGEGALEAAVREIQEELVYTPARLKHLGHIVWDADRFDVFAEEVGDEFEAQIEVLEGEYGAFVTVQGLLERDDVSPLAKCAVPYVIKVIAA